MKTLLTFATLILYPIFGATQAISAEAFDSAALLKQAFAFQEVLAYDDVYKTEAEFLTKARSESALFAKELDTILKDLSGTDASLPALQGLAKATSLLTKAPDEKTLRKEMIPFCASVIDLVKALKLTAKHQLYFCSMVKANWTQPFKENPKVSPTENMANPLEGKKAGMLKCGIKKNWPKP